MKILILANKSSLHAKKCAEGLASRGHMVFFVSPKEKGNEFSKNIQTITLKYGGKAGYVTNCLEFRKVYKRISPDVVNVHYASGCGLLAFLSGVHFVLNCYGSDIFEFPNICELCKWLLKRILNRASIIASTSQGMADEIRHILGKEDKFISITPFGIDVDLFKPFPGKHSNSRLVIGIVKSLKPIYDIPLLIEAFSILCKRIEHKPLLRIYGDGPLKSELMRMCVNLSINESVEFMGGVPNEQVPRVLSMMDIFVNCSKQESFGVNILEAMSCGLPVLATDCVGPLEIIENGVSGIILNDRSPQTMAEEIISLILDDNKRKKLGEAGRARVLEKYDWNKNLDALEAVMIKARKASV